jgi:DNA-binding MarR family transcriptional regulator
MKKMTRGKNQRADTEAQFILDSIRRLVRGLRQSSLESERRHGLSSAQLYVLNTLSTSEHPLSVNELADRTMTHQSSVSVVATKLVARGFVRKQRAAADSRRVELMITEAGRRALGKNPEPIQDRLIEAIQGLSPSTRLQLAKGFEKLLEASGLDQEQASLFFEESSRGEKSQ